ncbi:MAG: hypothetical protein ABIY56_03365 [Dokdonella sp.]
MDLHDAMLAELRQFGSALAACIVVTPVVDDDGSPAGHAGNVLNKHADASVLDADAKAAEETEIRSRYVLNLTGIPSYCSPPEKSSRKYSR